MKSYLRFLAPIGAVLVLGAVCQSATITGTVKGVDGAPFQGAFVQAQNTKTKITVNVLSDSKGRYRVEQLGAGEYRITIRAVGYTAAPQTGVSLTADQNASYDFALQKGMVRWNDLSQYQAIKLWPASKSKDIIADQCFICHGFETRIASVTRDKDGWRDRVDYMRTAMHFNVNRLSDQDADDLAGYLASLYGPDSVLPKSPVDMPGYKETVRPFSSDAMNIVYVEYDMPGPSRMPFSAAPDKDGNMWIPNFGAANKITKLNPKTGQMQDFSSPAIGTAAIHSTGMAPDGSVWITEQGLNRIGRFDPVTQKITEYQDPYTPGHEGTVAGGQKHTLRVDAKGRVWSSGVPLTMFDPETGKFTHFEEMRNTYDVEVDSNQDVWFTAQNLNVIGKVDGKTLKVSTWKIPTANSSPRRMAFDHDGNIWVGEFSGKLAHFDRKTETFKEYTLPGPEPNPYAVGVDADGYVWYNSHLMDVLARLDPKTGKVIEFPFPHSEICMREFFHDAQGRIWYGTNPNNKVGYFYLAGAQASGK
jgi:virginiamycin B lyase